MSLKGYVCPECGLAYDPLSPSDAKVAIRSYPRRYRSALAGALEDDAEEGLIRRKPAPDVWSALEYAAHVADVFDAMAEVVREMRHRTHPTLTMFDPDELAASSRYNEQAPEEVLQRLTANADRLATEVDAVQPEDWTRTATFPWGERDMLDMARNAVHEGTHHLRDLERVLDQARGRA